MTTSAAAASGVNLNASSDSSVIFYDGNKQLNKRYNVSFSIDSSRNFAELSKIVHIAQDAPVWLSWTIFEKTVQTDEFPNHSTGISNYKDTVLASCTVKAIIEQFPLRIYLCTHDRILGVAEVSKAIFKNQMRPVPLQYTNWLPFSLGAETDDSVSSSFPEIAIQLTVLIDEISDSGGAVGHGAVAIGTSEEEDYGLDEFDETETENEANAGVAGGADTDVVSGMRKEATDHSHPHPHQHGDGHDDENENEDHHKHKKTATKHARFEDKVSNDNVDDNNEVAGEAPEEAEFVDEFENTHHRMSIVVKTIGGLKRPSHVQIQFVYPHFGSNTHIRSHPMWVSGSTEAKVEGAVAVYDFCMTKAACKSVCITNPLYVHVLSRTNLGNEPFGDFAVDLSAVLTAKVDSVRCPITNRTFKHMSDYAQYRSQLQHQQQAEIALGKGVFTMIPPAVPVVVKVVDTYYDVMEVRQGPVPQGPGAVPSEHGAQRVGKVRVQLILEDIGTVVGSGAIAHAVPVKPGYKHGSAAVYQQQNINTDQGHGLGHNGTSTTTSTGTGSTGSGGVGVGVEHYPPVPPNTNNNNNWSPEESDHRFNERVEREVAKRMRKLSVDMNKHFANKADDLRRAQEETNKLELKLRTTIESAEKQRNNLILQEEQMHNKLIQKTNELQLLQKRVRDEAAVKIEAEVRKSTSLQQECDRLREDVRKERARYKEVDEMYDRLKNTVKNMSEMQLKEEVSKARTQYLDCKAELERERRMRAETEAEKEHVRAQMHRVALALKREREKNATVARQDLEQLRLEYLAREERYVRTVYVHIYANHSAVVFVLCIGAFVVVVAVCY